MGGGNGDDFWWEVLACPPLEDYAFNFDTTTSSAVLDDLLLDDPLLDDDLLDNQEIDTKANVGTYGRGKELMTSRQVVQVEKQRGTGYACQSKDRARLGCTNQVVAVQGKGAKVNDCPDPRPFGYGNHGKGKEIKALSLSEARVKAFLGETDAVEEHNDKKRKLMDCYDFRPMQRKDMMRLPNTNQLGVVDKKKADKSCQPVKHKDIMSLEHTNQCAVGEKRKSDYGSKPVQVKSTRGPDHANQTAGGQNWRIGDYESKFEASRWMLHKAYGEAREVKERRNIQVIDFQKPEAQQPGSKAKARGKASLRQKLMTMGTRKSSKKFPPYKMLSSCNQ